eukprot:m.12085 g.12085  ORF g.12085 m.12085 type:complete len:326 (+) comp7955_c0_seq1:135-1112(+)
MNTRAPLKELPSVVPGEYDKARGLLAKHGVCVFKDVANQEELAKAEGLFWDFIKSTGLGINKNDPKTLSNEHWDPLGFIKTGVVANYSIGQSDFMWYCRMLPGVHKVFAAIWEDEDLVTSFDGCGAARNPFLAENPQDYATKGGWLHVDQNGTQLKGLNSYQGLLNFFPSNSLTGGNVVVPDSVQYFTELFEGKTLPPTKSSYTLDEEQVEKYCSKVCQSPCGPGDFVVWDSRTVHCSQGINLSHPAKEILPGREKEPIIRLVSYICMIPRSHLDETAVQRRKKYVMEGRTSTHDPKVPVSKRDNVPPANNFTPPPEDSPIWKLV